MNRKYESILPKELLQSEYIEKHNSISKIAKEWQVPRKAVADLLDQYELGRTRWIGPRLHDHPRWRGVGRMPKTLINRITNNAKLRGIPYDVTMEELWSLYDDQQGKCALSGMDIGFGYIEQGRLVECTASLDRIDSADSYRIDNLCWLHKNVNLAKQALSVADFVDLCKKVANHVA